MSYRVVHVMGNDAVVLASKHGQQIWTTVKVCGRPKECCECSVHVVVGDKAFRPITNGYNRMKRMCVGCMNGIVQRGGLQLSRSSNARSTETEKDGAPNGSSKRERRKSGTS